MAASRITLGVGAWASDLGDRARRSMTQSVGGLAAAAAPAADVLPANAPSDEGLGPGWVHAALRDARRLSSALVVRDPNV